MTDLDSEVAGILVLEQFEVFNFQTLFIVAKTVPKLHLYFVGQNNKVPFLSEEIALAFSVKR